jgi:hypothetical protein
MMAQATPLQVESIDHTVDHRQQYENLTRVRVGQVLQHVSRTQDL